MPGRCRADRRLLAPAVDVRGRRTAPVRLCGRARPGPATGRAARGCRSPRRLRHRRPRPPRPRRALRPAPRPACLRAAGATGRGVGRAPGPRHAGHDGLVAAPARRRLVARRPCRARQRRPPHGARALGAPAQPRPRGAGLAPAAGGPPAQLVRRARRRRARHQGLRRARRRGARDGLRARSGHAPARGSAAGTARAVHRAPVERRRTGDRGRDHDGSSGCASTAPPGGSRSTTAGDRATDPLRAAATGGTRS
jgi:hypothetical protein